jgi:hypothetical protein
MNITDPHLTFCRPLRRRERTTLLILHHTGTPRATPQALHALHLANGWEGAGYHYLVGRTGQVWSLRPAGMAGRHAAFAGAQPDDPPNLWERQSVALCFEGCFEPQAGQAPRLTPQQYDAGLDLVGHLAARYPDLTEVLGHGELSGCATSCPGSAFPVADFAAALAEARQALGPRTWQVVTRGEALPLHAGPGERYAVLARLEPGTRVSLLGNDAKLVWRQVRCLGRTGYVNGEYLLPLSPGGECMHLRKEGLLYAVPDRDTVPLVQLPAGSRVYVNGERPPWYRVQAGGRLGYLYLK